MIKINGRIATTEELEATLKQMNPEQFRGIIEAMLTADPHAALHAMQVAINTLKSERKPSDPNTNH
jgi:hypothetical protein